MCACASNHPSTCAILLSYNVDLCAVNDRGLTAFHIVAFLGSLPVLQELLNSSLNDELVYKAINQGDIRNQTPLFYACNEGHLDIALALIRAGANAYHLDNDNQTCLHSMLSSTIILKRHIRLFYTFIQYVDYRLIKDYFKRTLLDLAYSNQLKTIIYLLELLNYKTNAYKSLKNQNSTYYCNKEVISLRHICILNFKRSINYDRYHPQPTHYDLLVNALQQTFQIVSNKDFLNAKPNRSNDYSPVGKSLDDMSALQQQSASKSKTLKPVKNPDKKSKKSPSIFSSTSVANKWSSQTDLQPSISTWSAFTHKIKGQRLTHIPVSTFHVAIDEEIDSSQSINPMKNLAFAFLTSTTKLEHLIDFPPLKNDDLLYEDLKLSMSKYHLLEIASSSQG